MAEWEVITLLEQRRGCGYRKPGFYIIGEPSGEVCERLPLPIGGFAKFSRAWTRVDFYYLFDKRIPPQCDPEFLHHHSVCPACTPLMEYHYLLWVGKKNYTVEEFNEEARTMGISRRVPFVPDDFEFGKTWVALAHIEASMGDPGVFRVFKPRYIDVVVEDEDNVPKEDVERLIGKYGADNVRVVKVVQA